MFCSIISVCEKWRSIKAYQFKLRLPPSRDADGLNALFLSFGVVEAQEDLVRLHALASLLVQNLEGNLEVIGWGQGHQAHGLVAK